MKIEITENEAIIDGKKYVLEPKYEQKNPNDVISWIDLNRNVLCTRTRDGGYSEQPVTFDETRNAVAIGSDAVGHVPEPTRDPYLTPGQPCEVWDNGEYKRARYFSVYDNQGEPTFVGFKETAEELGRGNTWDHYRPIGTVWDFIPDWVEWIAMDEDGRWFGYELQPLLRDTVWVYDERNSALLLKPPFPYTGDWTESLHRRPEWARRKA